MLNWEENSESEHLEASHPKNKRVSYCIIDYGFKSKLKVYDAGVEHQLGMGSIDYLKELAETNATGEHVRYV
ncbi:hypothetical protein KAR91_54575 [Candidatus Pacearchaeota archaeon]|nr:hypothetical protein [Candidatus Pacearchaeota archaeon]